MTVEREILEMDVLLVGAGPANLSCALHLPILSLHTTSGLRNRRQALEEINIAVIEKAAEIGAHQLSGAVLDPVSLRELIPDFEKKALPSKRRRRREGLFPDRARQDCRADHPPPLRNHGNYVVSINKLVRWLAEKCEAAG